MDEASFGHLIPKRFVLFPLDDPIHIPSVLEGLIAKADSFLKSSSNLKRMEAELASESTAVVLPAYWRSLVSSFPMVTPFIDVF